MDPYLLDEQAVDIAAQVFVDAFVGSPIEAFVFPDGVPRTVFHYTLFAAMTRLAIRHGDAVALGDPPAAVALWLLPEREPLTEADFVAAGMGALAELLDADEATRLETLNAHFDAAHQRMMDEPHGSLLFLAVAPEYQGIGLGSRLMRHALDQADAAGWPCYTESADARNLPFYERLGFQIMETSLVPGSQVRTWALQYGAGNMR